MKLLADIKSGEPIKLMLTFGNVGKEPAKNVGRVAEKFVPISVETMKFGTIMEEFSAAIESETAEASCGKSSRRYLGTIYPAGAESNYVMLIAPADITEKVLQGHTLIVRGCFQYQTAGAERHSGFCYLHNVLTPNQEFPGTFRSCPIANDAN
jgi:hypothetical protein